MDRRITYVPGMSRIRSPNVRIADPIKLASTKMPSVRAKAVEAMEDVGLRMHLYRSEAVGLRTSAAAFFRCRRTDHCRQRIGRDHRPLCRAYLEPGDEVMIPNCTFSYCRIASLVCGADVLSTSMRTTPSGSISSESVGENQDHFQRIPTILQDLPQPG